MRRWVVICGLILPGLVSSATARDGKEAAVLVKAFSLADVKKQTHTAAEWKGKKAVVLIFLGTECPVSNGYAPEYALLAKAFGKRGVAFYGLHPAPDVTEEAAIKHAKEYKLTFPILLGPMQKVTKRAGVTVTPEVVVLTPAGRVLYRGRVDDRYSFDRAGPPASAKRDAATRSRSSTSPPNRQDFRKRCGMAGMGSAPREKGVPFRSRNSRREGPPEDQGSANVEPAEMPGGGLFDKP
jgi:peroxiredoxin